jgi:hypothetical protein
LRKLFALRVPPQVPLILSAALRPVLGITPGIWLLWQLRCHEPRGFLGNPAFTRVKRSVWLGALFASFNHFTGGRLPERASRYPNTSRLFRHHRFRYAAMGV